MAVTRHLPTLRQGWGKRVISSTMFKEAALSQADPISAMPLELVSPWILHPMTLSCATLVPALAPAMNLLLSSFLKSALHFLSPMAREKHTRLWLLWTEKTYKVNSEINVIVKLNLSRIFVPAALNRVWGTQWIISSITVYKEQRQSFQMGALDLVLYIKAESRTLNLMSVKTFSQKRQVPQDLAMFNSDAQNWLRVNSEDENEVFVLGGLICHQVYLSYVLFWCSKLTPG